MTRPLKDRTHSPGYSLYRRIGLGIACLTILGAVFCLYWRPDMAFDLATRIWSCI